MAVRGRTGASSVAMGGILSKLGGYRLGIASVFYTSLDVRLWVEASGGEGSREGAHAGISFGFFSCCFLKILVLKDLRDGD
jgi:hypothetical protein